MRKGLTLLELIFTIVIIALVFTVIPKVVISLNKSDTFSIRQDGLFAGTSFVTMASKLLWDHQNGSSNDILHVSSSSFTCNDLLGYRIGGFIGSRRCDNNLSALSIQSDTAESSYELFNDIDDYHLQIIPVKTTDGSDLYELNTTVEFLPDTIGSVVNYTPSTASASIDLRALGTSGTSTNIKKMSVIVRYIGKRGTHRQISQFEYISPNLGYISLNKRVW